MNTESIPQEQCAADRQPTPLLIQLKDKILSKTMTPGSYYGEPGQGDSRLIAIATTICCILLWLAATELGLDQASVSTFPA